MEIEPKYADLRATHHESLAMTREIIPVLSGWLGDQLYIEQYGHPRLRARHMPFKVSAIERDQWVACMARRCDEINVAEALFQKLINSFITPPNGCAISPTRGGRTANADDGRQTT